MDAYPITYFCTLCDLLLCLKANDLQLLLQHITIGGVIQAKGGEDKESGQSKVEWHEDEWSQSSNTY